MSFLFNEIRYATWLVQTDNNARQAGIIDGQIAPCVHKKIKNFLFDCKKMFQSFNLADFHNRKEQDFYRTKKGNIKKSPMLYIKSFFYDIDNDYLILYCRIYGKDTPITITNNGKIYSVKNANTGGNVQEKITRFLIGICEYWIPSEQSFERHTVINLMPAWRQNPNMA